MDGKDVDGNVVNVSMAEKKRPDYQRGGRGGRGGYDNRRGSYNDRRYDDRRYDRRDDRRGGYSDRRYDDRRDDRRGEYSDKRRSRSRSKD